MALIVGPSEVKPHDFEKIVKPTVCHFADAMCARFAGAETLDTTIDLFCYLTEIPNRTTAARWLYEHKTVEQIRRIQQHRRCNA